jgi:uncharacterized protein with FMN-binding domain
MLRAVMAIGGTAAGLAALLSFKTHVPAATVADSGAAALPTTSASGRPTVATPSKTKMKMRAGAKGTATSSAKPRATMTAGASAPASAAATRTITGAVETTMFGPMQVKVTLDGTRITNVAVVQETNDGQESQSIDAFAIPKLTAETLTAQSARIDAVSGATTTSQGYIGSLQSALDQA